jgi:hypothetical protein
MIAASKTTPKPAGHAAKPAPAATAPKSTTLTLDDTMVGNTLAAAAGVIIGLSMTKQGEVNVTSDGLGHTPVSGYFALTDGVGGPRLVGFYNNDQAGGAFARPLSIPFATSLIAAQVPRGSAWAVTIA